MDCHFIILEEDNRTFYILESGSGTKMGDFYDHDPHVGGPIDGVDAAWADIVQIARAKPHGSDEDLPPLRMGVGEDIPMNPISIALSDAVTEASRRLRAKLDSDTSFSI